MKKLLTGLMLLISISASADAECKVIKKNEFRMDGTRYETLYLSQVIDASINGTASASKIRFQSEKDCIQWICASEVSLVEQNFKIVESYCFVSTSKDGEQKISGAVHFL